MVSYHIGLVVTLNPIYSASITIVKVTLEVVYDALIAIRYSVTGAYDNTYYLRKENSMVLPTLEPILLSL